MKDLLTMTNYDLILVDTMNLAARCFYGMKNLSYKGKPTGMIYGVAKFAFKCKAFYPKARIVFLWEGTNSRRKSMDDSYKAGRVKDNDFRSSVQELKPFLDAMEVDQLYHLGLEADDLAGYMAATLPSGQKALLVSTDEDWFQFMKPGTIDLQRRDIIETFSDLEDALGFPPDRIGIWKILKGDMSDEIKGLKNCPGAVARLLTNRCETYQDIFKYKLSKHNELWTKWEIELKKQKEMLDKNAEMILFHPEWIETSQIISKHGKLNNEVLRKILTDNGLVSLLKELR